MKILFLLPALAAVPFWTAGLEFDPKMWSVSGSEKGAVFEFNEFNDGVLHLKDSADGAFNNQLQARFTGGKLGPFRGKRMIFSARIEQLSASRADSVGLTLNVKTRDGKNLYRSARVPAKGKAAPMYYSVAIDVPEDAAAFGAAVDCALG